MNTMDIMDIIYELLMATYLAIVPSSILFLLYKIWNKLNEIANINQTEVKRRTHPSIAKNNYNNILTTRKGMQGYDQYKNKSGLYEPVTPNNGIRIKKKED